VAGLFAKHRQGTVLASLSGAFQVSGLVFLVLTVISTNRKKSFGSFSGCLILLTVMAAIILPKHHFAKSSSTHGDDLDEMEAEEEEKLEINITDVQDGACVDNEIEKSESSMAMISSSHTEDVSSSCPKNNEHDDSHNIETVSNQADSSKKDTAVKLICTMEYFLLIFWFSVLIVPLQYYIATIGFQLERKGDSGTYTSLFSITYASAAGLSPFGGKIADICGLGIAQACATLLSAASFFILASDVNLNLQVLGLVSYGIGRMMTFGMFFSNVGKRFGYTHYGTLAGLGLITTAVVSLAQYPLISMSADGDESIVNLACGVSILILTLPYCLWLGLRERK